MSSCLVHFWSADMKTSAGEPAVIWVYSALDESEFSISLQLFAFSKSEDMFCTTWIRLEAMNTLSSVGAGVAVGDGEAVGFVVGAAVGLVDGIAVGDAVGEVESVGVGVIMAVGTGVGVADGFDDCDPW